MLITRFIETQQFTAQVVALGAEESLGKLQNELGQNPEAGDALQGTGGFRKIRMALPGRGKSGGARVIYYYLASRERIVLFYLFTKNEAANISKEGAKSSAKRRQTSPPTHPPSPEVGGGSPED